MSARNPAKTIPILSALKGAWREKHKLKTGRSFDLGKMTLPDLWVAYLTYPTILLYLLLTVLCFTRAISEKLDWLAFALTLFGVIIIYPFAWYGIHKFILHARWPYRNPMTAGLWKRIHFDHHQDPHLLDVLFGAPYTTIPTIAAIVMPFGFFIGGWASAWIALGTGLAVTCFYEFFHCIQHLAYKPKWRWVSVIKQLHVLHHFHDEDGNYGITNYLPDRLFNSYYPDARARPRSPHAFNLGYDLAEAQRYPWVMQKTGAPPRQKAQGASPASSPHGQRS